MNISTISKIKQVLLNAASHYGKVKNLSTDNVQIIFSLSGDGKVKYNYGVGYSVKEETTFDEIYREEGIVAKMAKGVIKGKINDLLHSICKKDGIPKEKIYVIVSFVNADARISLYTLNGGFKRQISFNELF